MGNRPTLVSNVETLAHMALIARHGAEWFRALGSPTQPGSVLVTLGGAVARPGVYEIAFASRMADLLRAAGGVTERSQALLVGGYGGAWLDAQHMQDLTLSEGDPLLAAGSIGAGVLWVLGEGSCGVWESRASWTTSPSRAPASADRACTACAPSPTASTSSPAARARTSAPG